MKKLYLLLATTLLFASQSMAQSILEWNFYNAPDGGKDVSYNSTYNDNDLNVSVLTRGVGAINNNGYSHGIVATLQAGTTEQDAIDNGDYFEFSVSSLSGKTISLTSLFAQLRTQNTATYRWKYSLDGTTFINLTADPVDMATNVGSTGIDQPVIDLGDIAALQDVPSSTTIIFRLYFWGGTATQGFGFGKSTGNTTANYVPSLVLNGVVGYNTIAGWGFATTGNPVAGGLSPTDSNPNVSSIELSRGSGLKAGSLIFSYVSVGAAEDNALLSSSKAEAITNNEYYQMQFTINPSYKMDLNSLSYKFRRNAAGPAYYSWAYSLDGTSFSDISGAEGALVQINEGSIYNIDLSGVTDLQDVKDNKTVTLRMYVWKDGGTGTGVFGFARHTLNTSTSVGVPNSRTVVLKGNVDFSSSINADSDDAKSLSVISLGDAVKIVANNAGEQAANVRISDVSGRTVLNEVVYLHNGTNEITLPVNLGKGVYVLSLNNKAVKFIK